MNHPDLVSIITPAYRAAAFVGASIQSVIAQTYTNWEMLVVDDCSPDNTVEIVRQWSEQDSRVRLIRQPQNGGPAAARNAALQAARGRWIAFLDSDDLWQPEKLALQLKAHRDAGATLSFTEFRRISQDGVAVGRLITVPSRITYSELLGNTAIATSSVIVDKSLTGDFVMKKVFYDDFACWLELLRKGGFGLGVHADLLRYRIVGGSVSRNKKRSAQEVWKTYRHVEQLGVLLSAWYFINYAFKGWLKYRKF